jgi:hypothetical protein
MFGVLVARPNGWGAKLMHAARYLTSQSGAPVPMFQV